MTLHRGREVYFSAFPCDPVTQLFDVSRDLFVSGMGIAIMPDMKLLCAEDGFRSDQSRYGNVRAA